MRKHKIVHLSSVHSVFDTRILIKECSSLYLAGYDVRLIGRGENDTLIGGVKVRTLPCRSGGRIVRMTWSVFDVFRMAIQEQGDVYHFHDPELIPVGLLLRCLGKRVIYDVHEHVAKDIMTKPWIPARLRRTIAVGYSLIEKASARVFNGVIVATSGIAQAFPGIKPVVIQNYPILDESEGQIGPPHEKRPPTMVYVGSITKLRGITEMVRALAILNTSENRVRMTLVGSFAPSQLEHDIRSERGWENVDYKGQLGRSDVQRVFSNARIGLVVFQPAPNHMDSQPNKLFEYMAAGLPIVASNFPYWKNFVEDIGSGFMVDPLNPNEIAKAINWLIMHPEEAEEMGQRGRNAVLKHYSWEGEARKLIAFYREEIFG